MPLTRVSLTLDNVRAALSGAEASPAPGDRRGPHPPTPSPASQERGSQNSFLPSPVPTGKGDAHRQVRAANAPGEGLLFPSVSTDTRTLAPGALFVALQSDKVDGHDFIPQALAAGAAGLVVSRDIAAPGGVPVLRVPDTLVAYGQIARAWREKHSLPVIGVTGSVGKTTLKEMLAAALSPLGPVLKTAASQNNESGVPKALLQLNETHRAAVIEMGMRGAGQIAYLCEVARPTVGILTVIGDNHAELLGSRDAIADAKGELLAALPAEGLAVLNADDPYLPRLRARTTARVVTYGVASKADYRAESACRAESGWRFTVQGVPVEIASPARHDVSNALAALAVAAELGVPLADAARAVADYAPPPMRMQVVPTGWGGTVLNDAYNAAPASVRSALQTLAAHGGRRIAFLGDMRELGELSEAAHRELGTHTAGLDALYTVGPLAALVPGAAARFGDSDEAAQFVRKQFTPQAGDVVLVKGSRAMAMERVADALLECANGH